METLFYRRNLPHWQPKVATFFVTTRLYGSIPKLIIENLKVQRDFLIKEAKHNKEALYVAQKRYFKLYDDALDRNPNAPYWLLQPEIAEIISNSLHFRDKKLFDLWAFSIMPNHIHLLLTTYETNNGYLCKILQDFKKYTGREANKTLNRTGNPFWEEEYYDHVVRDEAEFCRIENYILQNPVKAGFVKEWQLWKWNYQAED
jgi:putative transposase